MFKEPAIRLTWFYALSLLFILLNGYMMVKKETMLFSLLPVVLLMILVAVFSTDRLLYLITFFTPLSVPLSKLVYGLPFDMFLPTEPLIFGLLLLFVLRLAGTRSFDAPLLQHPISMAVWALLFWILITTITSTMPLVSVKFLLVRIWFIVVFYLMAYKLFDDAVNFRRFVWIYISGLLLVIGYTIFRHSGYGLFNKQAAHWVMTPFFNDHTSYGAVLAMFIPVIAFFSFGKYAPTQRKWLARGIFGILLIAFVLSYTRAAWLSLIVAIGIWVLMLLKIRFRSMVISAVVLIGLVFTFQQQIVHYLERNDDESSSNLLEHFSSMSNITSDASNLERLNRWGAAYRMFQEKPFWGFGPGTYMFKYAPYQLTRDKTIISTNMGDAGNAHSEYFGPLAESGIFGFITMLLLMTAVLYTAISAYTRLEPGYHRGLLLAVFLGLLTYYVHGVMNNFLDTDKVAVPFWSFTAVVVWIDLRSRSAKQA